MIELIKINCNNGPECTTDFCRFILRKVLENDTFSVDTILFIGQCHSRRWCGRKAGAKLLHGKYDGINSICIDNRTIIDNSV